jgi:hypothetical protein
MNRRLHPHSTPPFGAGQGVEYLPLEQNVTFIRRQQADNMFEQHAFPDAAFADNGGNLSLEDGKIHALEHSIFAEALVYLF